MGDILTDSFDDPNFCVAPASDCPSLQENLFSFLETLKRPPYSPDMIMPYVIDQLPNPPNLTPSAGSFRTLDQAAIETDDKPKGCKRRKTEGSNAVKEDQTADGPRASHMTVERNRRKQMNDHLSVLRSLMPCFYVKRGDQASIIGGVVEFIKELQTLLQSLEAKKQRKINTEVLSPRSVSFPRTMSSPRPTPVSPRVCLPISPRTPQSASPYKPKSPLQLSQPAQHVVQQLSFLPNSGFISSPRELTNLENGVKELAGAYNSKSAVADVEVKFSGRNLLLKTVSHRIPGQTLKIMAALESLSLEILHVSISTVDDTMYNTFTIKIEIECKLSAEELAQEIQRTFHQAY